VAIILRAKKIFHQNIHVSLHAPINLTISSKQVLCLFGSNGSGKTTLLDILAKLTPPSCGTLTSTESLGLLSHGNGFCEELSIKDHLALYNMKCDAFIKYGFNVKRPLRFFSRGQKRFIALLILFLQKKSLWLLDEPFSNLDAQTIKKCTPYIEQHIANNGALIFTANTKSDIAPFSQWQPDIFNVD